MSVTIAPGSNEWSTRISPSKVAAILGVSRYKSPFQLWHQMKHALDPAWHEIHGYADPKPEPHKDIFDTGHALELALAYLWKLDNPGWQLSAGEVQVVRSDLGFPALATVDRRARKGSGYRRCIEFKSARSLSDWGDDFSDEAPGDYIVQVQTQMHFTGWTDHPAHLTVMGPYLKHHTYAIPYDAELGAHIEAACQNWWRSLLQGDEPDLDNRVETYELIREMHPDLDGTSVELDRDLALEWLTTERDYKAIEAARTGVRSRVLAVMERAQLAELDIGEKKPLKIGDRRRHSRGGIALVPAINSLDKLKETAA